MAALRKANAYSKRKVAPFTRWSKKRVKGYIKMVPPQKIVKFCMGKSRKFIDGKFSNVLTVISTEPVQIRNNALEACRQFINKKLNLEFNGDYFFQVVPFPHHIQREHRMLTGAGADRMSSGMQLSFGRSMNKACILKTGATIFIIGITSDKGSQFARKVVKKVKAKLPCQIKINEINAKDKALSAAKKNAKEQLAGEEVAEKAAAKEAAKTDTQKGTSKKDVKKVVKKEEVAEVKKEEVAEVKKE